MQSAEWRNTQMNARLTRPILSRQVWFIPDEYKWSVKAVAKLNGSFVDVLKLFRRFTVLAKFTLFKRSIMQVIGTNFTIAEETITIIV